MSPSLLMLVPAGLSAGVSAAQRIRGLCLMRWSRLQAACSLAVFVWLVTSVLMVFGMPSVRVRRVYAHSCTRLMGAAAIVGLKVVIQYSLHFLNGLEPALLCFPKPGSI
jgi:hypothetical protein